MNERGKSDERVVPKKATNKEASVSAESLEERRSAKGNSPRGTGHRTQDRVSSKESLKRVHEAALGNKELRFTTLWHHVYRVDALREAFLSLEKNAAPGVDEQTWRDYAGDLESHLEELSERLERGAYRAPPVRRVLIPKADGRQRPIGIPTLEDKIVQRATVAVLNAVYEVDFLDFSYGFRPGRNQHNALDALAVGITRKKVNWVLDADIRGFFDALNHEWLVRFVEHRIADKRIVRHVKKWLHAGVLVDGQWKEQKEGTPQGGSISPLLANIYLHYAFDQWVQQWRTKQAQGDVIVVRYADDFVLGFEYREEAERFLEELKERLGKFGLELHPEKTRLLEFGRFAADRRGRRGEGKPESFDFLGFTHICGKKRAGGFIVLRRTVRKRMTAKCHALKVELRKRLHWRLSEVGAWLRSVLLGHYRYYGVPLNSRSLSSFRHRVERLWYRSIQRRSHRSKWSWARMRRLSARWLPTPRIQHPYPWERLRV